MKQKLTLKQRNNNEGGVTGKGFKPGQSGNPDGRPKGSLSIPHLLRRIGIEKAPVEIAKNVRELYGMAKNKSLTMFECFVRLTYIKALEGDIRAIDWLSERTEGKVSQAIELKVTHRHKVEGEEPIEYLNDYISRISQQAEA